MRFSHFAPVLEKQIKPSPLVLGSKKSHASKPRKMQYPLWEQRGGLRFPILAKSHYLSGKVPEMPTRFDMGVVSNCVFKVLVRYRFPWLASYVRNHAVPFESDAIRVSCGSVCHPMIDFPSSPKVSRSCLTVLSGCINASSNSIEELSR